MPIAIDKWSAVLSKRTASETGWRGSEIYSWIVAARVHSTQATVKRALQLHIDLRRHGESFQETRKRLGEIAIGLEGG